jgi:hypothetical protein
MMLSTQPGALRPLVEDEGDRDFIDRVSYLINKQPC